MDIKKEVGWKLHPVGGDTGKAYMGTRDQEKVFLKRNTSPFLATLALEGIAPKIVWTRRTENGDVLTAQVWCNGRTLVENEMEQSRVVQLLKKVHQSEKLGRLLEKVEGKYLLATDLLDEYVHNLSEDLKVHQVLDDTYSYLLENLDDVDPTPYFCASHGDIHHDNYLLSEHGELYLVDWDNAILADPAYDLGQLLARYIKENKWREWMEENQILDDNHLDARVYWYALMILLLETKDAFEETNDSNPDEWLKSLKYVLEHL